MSETTVRRGTPEPNASGEYVRPAPQAELGERGRPQGRLSQFKFPQSKSTFRLQGVVVGKDTPRRGCGLSTGQTKDGKDYRSLRFFVKTSEENSVAVELFGSVQPSAYYYNRVEKKTKPVPWEQRNQEPPEGYELIKPDYDLIEDIDLDFHDGDSVVVIGNLRYREDDRPGQSAPRTQTTFTITRMFHSDAPVDLSAAGDDAAIFSQELIVDSVQNVDGEPILFAHVVGYGDYIAPVSFELAKDNPKFAANVRRLKSGTFLKAEGVIKHRVVIQTVELDDDWGARQFRVASGVQKSLEITYVDPASITPDLYTPEMITDAIRAYRQRREEKNASFAPARKEPASTPAAAFDRTATTGNTLELPFEI